MFIGPNISFKKSEWTFGLAPYFFTKLERVAIYFSKGYSWPRDWTYVLCIAGRFLTAEPPGKPHSPLLWVNLSGVMKNGVCCVCFYFLFLGSSVLWKWLHKLKKKKKKDLYHARFSFFLYFPLRQLKKLTVSQALWLWSKHKAHT